MKFKTKPFDLEKAKAGAKLVTRRGIPARIVCYDAKGDYPVIAIVDEDDEEIPRNYTVCGRYSRFGQSQEDLFIVEEDWRANVGEYYYAITSDLEICAYVERNDPLDTSHHNVGNYFSTMEEALEKLVKMKKILSED